LNLNVESRIDSAVRLDCSKPVDCMPITLHRSTSTPAALSTRMPCVPPRPFTVRPRKNDPAIRDRDTGAGRHGYARVNAWRRLDRHALVDRHRPVAGGVEHDDLAAVVRLRERGAERRARRGELTVVRVVAGRRDERPLLGGERGYREHRERKHGYVGRRHRIHP
jgi:hypothetical protein